jgi:hypothetical protein
MNLAEVENAYLQVAQAFLKKLSLIIQILKERESL